MLICSACLMVLLRNLHATLCSVVVVPRHTSMPPVCHVLLSILLLVTATVACQSLA